MHANVVKGCVKYRRSLLKATFILRTLKSKWSSFLVHDVHSADWNDTFDF
jgi:hypothetical protein